MKELTNIPLEGELVDYKTKSTADEIVELGQNIILTTLKSGELPIQGFRDLVAVSKLVEDAHKQRLMERGLDENSNSITINWKE